MHAGENSNAPDTVSSADTRSLQSCGILGQVALASNDVSAAVVNFSQQKRMLENLGERDSLRMADVLEDLGWARLRETDELTSVAALEIVVTTMPFETGEEQAAETGAEMLQHAYRIRMENQGAHDPRMAICCCRLEEYHWSIDDLEEVIRLYSQAFEALKANSNGQSREAVMILAWQGAAHSLAQQYLAAGVCFERALRILDGTFGFGSWEHVRLLADQACLLQTLGESLGMLAAAESEETTEWAQIKSRRLSRQMHRLRSSLLAGGTQDDVPTHLAVFAPARRAELVSSLMRQPPPSTSSEDDSEASSSEEGTGQADADDHCFENEEGEEETSLHGLKDGRGPAARKVMRSLTVDEPQQCWRQQQQQRRRLQHQRLLEQQQDPIPKVKPKAVRPPSLHRRRVLQLASSVDIEETSQVSPESDAELAWRLSLESARRSERRRSHSWRLGFDDGFDTTCASHWKSSQQPEPRTARPHASIEVLLCCNVLEHKGGCPECILPAGHDGEHQFANLGRRRSMTPNSSHCSLPASSAPPPQD